MVSFEIYGLLFLIQAAFLHDAISVSPEKIWLRKMGWERERVERATQ